MRKKSKAWRTYEEVAEFLLNRFAEDFGLGHVEGQQIVPGASGTEWNIEAKGVLENNEGFIIVECKRYPKKKLNQEQVGGLAFRIIDTGAQGGIVVSPLDLQKGAALVARHSNIQHVKLTLKSSKLEYVLAFLNKIFIGLYVAVQLNATIGMKITRADDSVENIDHE